MPNFNTADTNIVHYCSQNSLSPFAKEELSADMDVCSTQNLKRRASVHVEVVVFGVLKVCSLMKAHLSRVTGNGH